MSRKEALISQAAAHLAVDFACFFLLAGNFAKTAGTDLLISAGYLIFLILSFGLRPLLALFLDEHPRCHSQAIGCLLVAVACLIPAKGAWIALFPAAAGSALFHGGALGESLAFARGYFSRNGTILSTGVFGAAAGTLLAQRTAFPGWGISIILTVFALACFFFAEARKYPRRIRSFRNSVTRKLPDWGILVLTVLPLFCATLTGALLSPAWAKGAMILIPAAACMLGRFAGGILADRFGPRTVCAVCYGAALILLTVFTHSPWAYCIGLAALCAPVSVAYGGAVAALPERPHLAVGVCATAVLTGAIPSFFPVQATDSVRFLVGSLLVLALSLSLTVHTGHTRIFDLRNRWAKRKKGRKQ